MRQDPRTVGQGAGIEIGEGALNFKLMLDLIMDVDDSSLRSIIQHLQTSRMKDVPGENVGVIIHERRAFAVRKLRQATDERQRFIKQYLLFGRICRICRLSQVNVLLTQTGKSYYHAE